MVFCWAWSKVWICVACEQILIIGARPELFFAREKFLGEAVRDLKSLALKMNAWLPANLHLTLLKSSHGRRNARPATLTKLINHQRLFCAIFFKGIWSIQSNISADSSFWCHLDVFVGKMTWRDLSTLYLIMQLLPSLFCWMIWFKC